ncbi:MAG: hypothetical protein K5739_06135 [Lachnospiraceae bacterium]|nr:hypothetical protein [Lachnospiraceae bacterium]
MGQEERFIVGGIVFSDQEYADLARTEAKRIEALNARINYENPKSVISLYQKAQENNVFKTPVGITYMLQLQDYLLQQGVPQESILPIDLEGTMFAKKEKQPESVQTNPAMEDADTEEPAEDHANETAPGKFEREGILEARIEALKEKQENLRRTLQMQRAVMIAMAVIIAAMFLISLTGNNPTILNYRSKIINQYSQWEQELTQREEALKAKEGKAGAGLPAEE